MENLRRLQIALIVCAFSVSGFCSAQDRTATYRIVDYGYPPSAQPAITGLPLKIPNPSYPNAPYVAAWPRDKTGALLVGSTTLLMRIDQLGNVESITVEVSSGHKLLDMIASDAARGWHFTPEIKNGRVVESYVRIPVNFNTPPPSMAQSQYLVPNQSAQQFWSNLADANRTPISEDITTPAVQSPSRGAKVGNAILKVGEWLGSTAFEILEVASQQRAQQQQIATPQIITPRTGYIAPPAPITTTCQRSDFGGVTMTCTSH